MIFIDCTEYPQQIFSAVDEYHQYSRELSSVDRENTITTVERYSVQWKILHRTEDIPVACRIPSTVQKIPLHRTADK